MNKRKSVNIIAILAIILTVVIVSLVLFFWLRTPKEDRDSAGGAGGMNLGETALQLETIDQFRRFAESGSYECYLGDDFSGGSIYKVPLLEVDTVVTYYFDKEGKTTDFEAFYYLNADVNDKESMNIEEITVQELATAAYDVIDRFCLLFGCERVAELFLTNEDGTFKLVESEADFQGVADGFSDLSFSVRAKDGYFWELTISANEKLVSVHICKYFNKEESMGYVANISLYEEE